jgi:hypothetical protein
MKEAQVYGTQMVLRSQVSYMALSRASKSGAKAFKRASAQLVEGMNNSIRKRLEIGLLYGQDSLGTVSSYSDNAGTVTITLTDATWSAGLWSGMEGARVDFFTTTTLDSSNNATGCPVTSVIPENKQIVCTIGGTVASEIANGDLITFNGARANGGAYSEMAGLKKILTNTGTLFNISASNYNLWAGNTKSSTGQFSHSKLQDGIALAVNKGLMGNAMVICSPKAWAVLNSDLAALRMFDGSYGSKKGDNGFEALTFHSSNGSVEVISHPFCKDGDAFLVPADECLRVGSTDLSFGVPGMDEQFFTLVAGVAAVELQCMTDQALFIEKPGHCVYFSGLTYA